MIWRLSNGSCVITVSGGLQKDTFFFKKLCKTLWDETEWADLIYNNGNFQAGSDKERIVETFNHINDAPIDFRIYLYVIDNIKLFT